MIPSHVCGQRVFTAETNIIKRLSIWTYQPPKTPSAFQHLVVEMQPFLLDLERISLPTEWLLNPEIKLKLKRYCHLPFFYPYKRHNHSIDLQFCKSGGARGVMVIDVGNGHSDTSSNPGQN